MILTSGSALGAEDADSFYQPGHEYLMPAPCCGNHDDSDGLSTSADIQSLWRTARNLLFPERVQNNPSEAPVNDDDWRLNFRANKHAIMITVGTKW